MNINLPKDCNNSLRQRTIMSLFFGVANHECDNILAKLTDDIEWEVVGIVISHGKDEVKAFLDKNRFGQVEEITLDYVLSNGNLGSVGGKITLIDSTIHFADFYEFTSHSSQIINKIKSFTFIEKRK